MDKPNTAEVNGPAAPAEGKDRSPAKPAERRSPNRSPAQDLADLLEIHRGERHAIVLQSYPDPDAIACAVAHQLISANFDITCEILYKGKISHPQNLAMVQLLGINLLSHETGMDLSVFDGAVFVDNQGGTSDELVDELEKAGVPALVVVDHHEPQRTLNARFSDIRPTGAAATIYSQYLEHGLVAMQKDKSEHVVAATALQLGLLTDTNQLLLAAGDDFLAARYLAQFSDRDLMQKILAQARPKHTMEAIRRALGNRVITDGYSIAGVEYLRAEDRDAIPQAADFLLTEENVHTSIVYGILPKDDTAETLVGSLRTTKLTLSPDKFLKEVLGRDENGQAYGGGKQYAGGFEIPVGFLSGSQTREVDEQKWLLFDQQIKNRLYKHIGADREED